jgi:serine/threonine protein kinase
MACRDLKPENIMLDADGYGIMIGMGFAKVIKGKCYTLCGTSEYLAPELCLGTGYNHGVDYFALGVLIYEMICGQTPFHDDHMDDILRNIIRGKVSFGSMFSESAKEVIQVTNEAKIVTVPVDSAHPMSNNYVFVHLLSETVGTGPREKAWDVEWRNFRYNSQRMVFSHQF